MFKLTWYCVIKIRNNNLQINRPMLIDYQLNNHLHYTFVLVFQRLLNLLLHHLQEIF